jgi:hypothetical protein
MAILFIAAFVIFANWYLFIYFDEDVEPFDEDVEPEEDAKKATDFLRGIPMGIQFTANDVKQAFKED